MFKLGVGLDSQQATPREMATLVSAELRQASSPFQGTIYIQCLFETRTKGNRRETARFGGSWKKTSPFVLIMDVSFFAGPSTMMGHLSVSLEHIKS